MSNTLPAIAIFYGVLWLLSFWVQNIIFSTIIGGFGVVLLIVVAIGMNNIFGEFDDNNEKLKIELEKLRKEIDELKKMKNVVG
jgi:hypothetical protein